MGVKVLVTRLDKDLPLPSYAKGGDAGADLVTRLDVTLEPGERKLVPTGISIALPDGYVALVHPRSGLAIKHGVTMVNSPGTVDAGYDGEIKVIVYNTNPQSYQIKKGQKIAQAVLCPVINGKFVTLHEVIELNEKERGSNGFGSTGI